MTRHRIWRLVLGCTCVVMVLFVTIQFYPSWLFKYTRSYRGFTAYSDLPIDPAIDRVIDDAKRRLSTSLMTQPSDQFDVYICNSPWRLRLFTGNAALGGGTVYATRNIFIRSADISSNSVRAPNGGALLDQNHRPLSYFIAHEATHVLLLRRYGLITMLRSPSWLVEGYADQVAKAGDFDLAENRMLFRQNNVLLTDGAARAGLYRRYQLMVETALGARPASIDALFANPPAETRILKSIGS